LGLLELEQQSCDVVGEGREPNSFVLPYYILIKS
jgi:hypothetical protein